jgi:G3E family GTPase
MLSFFVDDDISGDYYLDGIVTVVDSKFLLAHLDDTKPEGVENEAVEQLAFADRILTNKTDLVSADELTHLKKRIQSINGVAPIHDMQHGKIDLDLILNVRAFDLKKVLEVEPNFLQDQEHQVSVARKMFDFY